MLALFSLSALAATLTVGEGDDYATIGEAIAASVPGDLIVIGPGVYPEVLDLPHELHLEGASATETVILNPADGVLLTSASSLTLSRLTLDGDGQGSLLEINLPAEEVGLIDVDLRNDERTWDWSYTAEIRASGSVVLNRVRVSDTFDGVRTFASTNIIRNSTFERNQDEALSTTGATTITNCTFTQTRRYRALTISDITEPGTVIRLEKNRFLNNAGAVFINVSGLIDSEIVVIQNQFFGNDASESWTLVQGGALDITGTTTSGSVRVLHNVFAGNSGSRFGGAIRISSPSLWGYYDYGPLPVTLIGNTFVENSAPNGAHLWSTDDIGLQMANNIFVGATEGSAVEIGAVTRLADHNLYFANALGDLVGGAPGASDVFADPGFVEWSADGDPLNDDYSLTPDSPAIDGGHPRSRDPDGSPSDLGAL
jgi:hypothetical protein